MACNERKDYEDCLFLLEKMEKTEEGFQGVDFEEEMENLDAITAKGREKYVRIWKELLRKADY